MILNDFPMYFKIIFKIILAIIGWSLIFNPKVTKAKQTKLEPEYSSILAEEVVAAGRCIWPHNTQFILSVIT